MFFEKAYQFGIDPNHQDICIVRYINSGTDSLNRQFPPHSHNFYELDYTFDHTTVHEYNNRSVSVPANSLSFFGPLRVHSSSRDTRSSHMVIQFSPLLLQKILPGFTEHHTLTEDGALASDGFLKLSEESCHTINGIMQAIAALHPGIHYTDVQAGKRPRELSPTDKIQEAALLLMLIAELIKTGNLKIISMHTNTPSVSYIHQLVRQLIDHPEEKLSMEEAAAMANMSYSNFCRSFKSTTGYAYVDFCNMQRVSRAKELLKYTDLSVTEISIQLNFGSISYFNRIFKKFTGTSPLAYRLSTR